MVGKTEFVGFRIPIILFSEVNCKEKSAEVLHRNSQNSIIQFSHTSTYASY